MSPSAGTDPAELAWLQYPGLPVEQHLVRNIETKPPQQLLSQINSDPARVLHQCGSVNDDGANRTVRNSSQIRPMQLTLEGTGDQPTPVHAGDRHIERHRVD